MARKFREARQMNKLTVVEAAEKLGIKQPSLSAWENGSRTPTVDNLIAMAELYGVTTDYLLGRAKEPQGNLENRALTAEELRIRNGMPVWSGRYGWLLVDAGAGFLLRPDGAKVPLLD
ncbi:MAG: helix-turn-helix transcriptional regulator, partial [Oscillospiraceae bacterium]|nr:helix-turn-helix transcriptional regulator [Oscillospiraceae bacterium]